MTQVHRRESPVVVDGNAAGVAPALRQQVKAVGDLVTALLQVPAANQDVESTVPDVRLVCRQQVLQHQAEHRRTARRARLTTSGVRQPHVHPSDDTANASPPDPSSAALRPILRAIHQVRSQLDDARRLELVSVDEMTALHTQLMHLEAAAALMQYRRHQHPVSP